jgi:chemotaxis protein methyltransferase CheR
VGVPLSVKDADCVDFLRWVLPQLGLRWPGFRKVRRQVCRRLRRRLELLDLATLEQYRLYLAHTPPEWPLLDGLCRITISRFYRDPEVFDRLCGPVLHALAEHVRRRGERVLAAWSAGCGCGEEPYTLVIGARLSQPPLSDLQLRLFATDSDGALLQRAQRACYGRSSVQELPLAWVDAAFDIVDDHYCLRRRYREAVQWCEQDIRTTLPDMQFDLILCRNLAFTYFAEELQREVLASLQQRLRAGGVLVIGKHESLPLGSAFTDCYPKLKIFRKP